MQLGLEYIVCKLKFHCIFVYVHCTFTKPNVSWNTCKNVFLTNQKFQQDCLENQQR